MVGNVNIALIGNVGTGKSSFAKWVHNKAKLVN